jgi:hypothetical protein
MECVSLVAFRGGILLRKAAESPGALARGGIRMSAVIHREAVVGPDGKIEISAPELQPGQRVSVTIEPKADSSTLPTSEEKVPMIDIIEESPGQQLFKTADEVDEYIRQERDSWDR